MAVKRRTPNPAPDEIVKIAHAKREGARRFHIGQEQMLHTQAGYISADCFHHFQIPACSPAADHTYPGDVRFLVLRTGLRPESNRY
jgi:hypothetical protein